MANPASVTLRIAAAAAMATSVCSVVACQQILGLDEGAFRPNGAGGGASSSTSMQPSSSTTTSGGSVVTSTSTVSTSGTSTGSTVASSSSTGSGATSATSGSASTSTSATSTSATSSSSSGAGGANCTGSITVLAQNLIDDMEEGSPNILSRGGRSGSWFTYDDGTDGGVQMPTPGGQCLPALIPNGGRCGSLHAENTFGSGFTGYGAGLGFDLNHPGAQTRMPYNVSAFTGIAFWAFSSMSGGQDVTVQVLEQGTVPTSGGGTCTSNCNDNYFASVIFPSSGWVQIGVPFASLKQSGFGTPVAWDPSTVLAIQFVVDPALTFNFWVDDIGLY